MDGYAQWWVARFERVRASPGLWERAPSWQAGEVLTFGCELEMEEAERAATHPTQGTFYANAPLHSILRFIGASSAGREALLAALRSHRHVASLERDKSGWYRRLLAFRDPAIAFAYEAVPGTASGGIEAAGWSWALTIGDGFPAIESVCVWYAAQWIGRWPYATPMQYYLVRGEDDRAFADDEFSYEAYADGATKVRRFGIPADPDPPVTR